MNSVNSSKGQRQKRSFELDTFTFNQRKSICRPSTVDSLDLNLSATYDHQYDLFVSKADVVSQEQKSEFVHTQKCSDHYSIEGPRIVIGKYRKALPSFHCELNWFWRLGHLNCRWHNGETVNVQCEIDVRWTAYANNESRLFPTIRRWQYFQLLNNGREASSNVNCLWATKIVYWVCLDNHTLSLAE